MDYNSTSSIQNYKVSNNSSNHNNSYNNTNSTSPPDPYPYPNQGDFCWYYGENATQFTIILISIWGILTPPAIYCLYSQIRSDRVVPVFIINLLISDIFQMCCMILQVAIIKDYMIKNILIYYVYNSGVMASVFFMTLIGMERYLLIAWPFVYRFQQKVKVSASVSVVIWILSVFIGLINGLPQASLLVLSLPLLIFFLVRSIKALTTSHNVPPDERRQIIAVLTLVLFAYILTFLPRILTEFVVSTGWGFYDLTTYTNTLINFINVSCTLIQINPLTDLLLYILMKKWLLDKLLALLCCCRKTNNEIQQTNNIPVTT